MLDPEVVTDDVDIETEEPEEDRPERRWWGLLAVILLLLLLLCCIVTTTEVWITGGPQQARFIARNAECLQCHTELIPDFSEASVHSPFALKECTACHTRHGKKVTVTITKDAGRVFRRYATAIEWLPLKWWFALSDRTTVQPAAAKGSVDGKTTKSGELKGPDSELIMPETDLCWTCHGSMGAKLGAAFTHQPFEAGRCTNCHNPHASKYTALLTMAPNEICFTCHPIGMEIGREQAHPPVEQGWCTDCHDPHGSDFRGILMSSQRELCFRCHPSVASKAGMSVQHQPFLNDDCTGCHEPHGSDTRPLLIQEQPGLCYRCHPKIKDQFAMKSHHPVGVTLECGSCHDPHAAQYSGLITARDNSFCFECHSSYEVSFDASKHQGTLCIRCHSPHGSSYTPMLRDSNPDLCLECHARKGYDESTPVVFRNNHPVRPSHYDVNAEKALNCTSSCHNPHGTKYDSMLRFFQAGTDGNCLMCHALTPGNRVGIDF